MASPMEQSFRGKRILVVGGSPKETIDGVRHFANHRRDQSHGARMADVLADLGAIVTFVTVQSSEMYHPTVSSFIDTVEGRKIVSTKDLLDACAKLNSIQYDAVVQLANIPSIVPAQQSDHIKVKTDENDLVSLDVVGNISAIMRLRWMFPKSAVFGYDNRQQWFEVGTREVTQGIPAVTEGLVDQALSPQSRESEGQSIAGRKGAITSGPTSQPITLSGDVICMHQTVIGDLTTSAFIGVEAVANLAIQLLLAVPPKEGEARTLEFRQNPDFLSAVGPHASLRPEAVVGFTAEPRDVLEAA
jgi:phosphopantothenoylcysteine synthetase/decarboxylase